MKSWIIASLLILTQSVTAQAEDITDAKAIIEKANVASYYQGDDGRAEARMKIVDANGNTQTRQFTILRKDHSDQGDQEFLVVFSKPSHVDGTVFRVAKKVNSDDDRWLYLPALDLVKRISAGDKRTSFVGSHFFYEDVSGRNPNEDNFTLLSADDQFYQVKGEPKDPNTVEFSHYVASIDKNTFMPMTVTYFDAQNNPMRKMEVMKTEEVQGKTTVLQSKITQMADNSFTLMQFRGVAYNVGLPDSVFSERSLRTPPREWVK